MNERLSLQDLTDLLAKKQEITKKDAEAFLRELIAVVTENIEANESVKIKDFGTFKLVKVNARKSVDVNTGEAIEIAAHYKLSFNPDKLLKEAVNRPFAHFESVILEEGVNFDNIESEFEEEKGEEVEEDATVEEDIAEYIEEESLKAVAEDTSESVEPEMETDIQPVGIINIDISETEDEEEPATEIAESETITEESEKKTIQEAVEEDITEEETASDTDIQPVGIINTDIPEEEVEEESVTDIVESDQEKGEENLEPEFVPDDIISKIEEEAASRNVNIEDIVLIVREDEKKDKKPVADTVEESDDEELVYNEKPKRKGIRKRYISLAFFIFLIVAGFVIGGLYFQEIAKCLTEGLSDNKNITKKADLSDVESPLVAPVTDDSIAQKTDSIAVSPSTVVHAQDRGKDMQAPPPPPVKQTEAVTPQSTVNGALAIETIQPGHTLRNIALKYYDNKSFWVYIYEENKDKITNINNVPIGTKLTIPAPIKYGINPQDEASVKKAKAIEEAMFKRAGIIK